jgi:hypothetical protein
LSNSEVLVVTNTSTKVRFKDLVVQDIGLNRPMRQMKIAYTNLGTRGSRMVEVVKQARFFSGEAFSGSDDIAAFSVSLAPMEIQVRVPIQCDQMYDTLRCQEGSP